MKINFILFDLCFERHPYRITIRFRQNEQWFKDDYKEFVRLSGNDPSFVIKDNNPCLYDKGDSAGVMDCHYFFQDLFVAQKIFNNKPEKHVDIGSRIDGFVAHVASYREIELLDIRKMESNIPSVRFTQVDLMDENNVPENYCDSISCLHALEHFGLGRYGDKIDPDGHIKGFKNITKMLKTGGMFYFSVPLGPQRVEFNAHRVFCLSYLVDLVSVDYDIVTFSYVDNGVLNQDIKLTEENVRNSFGCNYGCAIFELRKK